ncbi:MAG: 16S rRNA (guanine(966)-N(2))-methyltransferase RsmD [Bdellovibrionaceae bacterium]|nr:16S rRNA (guanine(966)-N(2))-methyltransferase RsmD [Pseudobdellovibrionaceae bacterium]
MRIISGKYRGHALVSFSASHIRPTTDRVKESLFNIWQNQMEGARVLDLFSGTGNLGLEALSRGAASVQFVDAHPKSIQILRQNVEKLKLTEDHRIMTADVFHFLKRYKDEPFDLIFIDPPFTEAIADKVMGAVARSSSFHSNTLIAIESGRREKIGEDYKTLIRYDHREFGDKVLSLFRAKDVAETDAVPDSAPTE